MSARSNLFLVGCLLLAAACSSKTTATSPSTTVPDAVAGLDAKATDAKVPKGDGASGGDIEAVVCVALGKGECDTAAECGSGSYCDPCLRKCLKERPLCDPCDNDVQCEQSGLGTVCLPYESGGNFCGRVCVGNGGCPGNYTCETLPGIKDMQCVPKSKTCSAVGGTCKTDSDCPFQSICNLDYAQCVKGCTDDGNCTNGNVCSLAHCVPPCAATADCVSMAAEASCVTDADGKNHCKIPGGCLGSDECATAETHCDKSLHKCVPGCEVNGDCKDFAMECASGKCQKAGCTANWQCAFGEVCDVPAKTCKKAEGLYCATCNPDDQDVKDCGGKPNICFKMQDSQKNDKGAFCGITCSSDAGGPCPQGWACQDIKDDKGVSQGKLCLRQCYNQPVALP